MGVIEQFQQEQEREKIHDWIDLWFTDNKRSGYVAVTDFKHQRFYNSDEAVKLRVNTRGRKSQYMSLNAFGYNDEKKLTRQSKDLKQIRNIAIDIDQYKLGMSIDEAVDIVQSLVFDGTIPEPNMILRSRGIQLFYAINRGASPQMAWLAGYITEHLVMKLRSVNADSNATDMSRVMRVPDSVNERNNARVSYEIWNDAAYTLQELQTYCPPLESKKRGRKSDVIALPSQKVALFHRTNYLRQQDLRKLIKLRGGDMTGCRNVFVYILAYQQSLILQTDDYKQVAAVVEANTQDMYTTDVKAENAEIWFDNTVKSAHEDAVGFMNHLQATGYNVRYSKNDGIIKPYKTENIIGKLDISESEQHELATLVNSDIRRERDTIRKRRERRQQGMKSMSDYNADRQKAKLERIETIKKLKADGMKNVQIAKELDISKSRVSELLKECESDE